VSGKKIPKVAMKAARIETNISRERQEKIDEILKSGKGVYTRVIHAKQP